MTDNIFQLSNYNSSTINEVLKNKDCKSKNDCLNIGECDEKRHKCIFKDIYCSLNSCYKADGCKISYVNHSEPQYLKSCEINPTLIIETCVKEENNKCITRNCTSDEQCLSNLCVENKCLTNVNNHIQYCSNLSGNKIVDFYCKLNLREHCNENEDCYSNSCGVLKNGNINDTVCLESKTSFMNALAGLTTYIIVIASIIFLYFFYKRKRQTNL